MFTQNEWQDRALFGQSIELSRMVKLWKISLRTRGLPSSRMKKANFYIDPVKPGSLARA